MERLAGRPVQFFKGDVTCVSDLERVFSLYNFWAVIHFAAIKVTEKKNDGPKKKDHRRNKVFIF